MPDDRAVGGAISPSDHVDVFLTATVLVSQDLLDAGKVYSDRSTNIVYQDIEVLSKTGLNYIVKVPLEAAEEISHLEATGQTQFSLALRPDEDTRTVDASRLGETTNLIIQRYGLPVPEVYPAGKGGDRRDPGREGLAQPVPESLRIGQALGLARLGQRLGQRAVDVGEDAGERAARCRSSASRLAGRARGDRPARRSGARSRPARRPGGRAGRAGRLTRR